MFWSMVWSVALVHEACCLFCSSGEKLAVLAQGQTCPSEKSTCQAQGRQGLIKWFPPPLGATLLLSDGVDVGPKWWHPTLSSLYRGSHTTCCSGSPHRKARAFSAPCTVHPAVLHLPLVQLGFKSPNLKGDDTTSIHSLLWIQGLRCSDRCPCPRNIIPHLPVVHTCAVAPRKSNNQVTPPLCMP